MTSLFETQVQKEPRAESPWDAWAVEDVPTNPLTKPLTKPLTNPQPKVHQRAAELSDDAYGGASSSLVLAGQMKVGKQRQKDMWKEVRAALSCLLSGLLTVHLMAPLINGSST
jgi:hypothetical protein